MKFFIYYQYETDGSLTWFHPTVGFCDSPSLTTLFAECALELGENFELIECVTDFCDLRDRGLLDYKIGGAA